MGTLTVYTYKLLSTYLSTQKAMRVRLLSMCHSHTAPVELLMTPTKRKYISVKHNMLQIEHMIALNMIRNINNKNSKSENSNIRPIIVSVWRSIVKQYQIEIRPEYVRITNEKHKNNGIQKITNIFIELQMFTR